MKKRIAVLTGAGVSAQSGLGTYRDNGGLWDNYDPMVVASDEGWRRNPGLVLEFYNMQRAKLKEARPNAAHLAIAALEQEYTVDVITQNVDNLHERAGSTHVIHLHGEATKVRPQNCCNESDGFSERSVIDVGYDEVKLGDLAPNGAQLRPHIVFFGEAVPKMETAIEFVSKADIVLIVGTSLQVYPAAGLYRYAPAEAPIYLIDPAEVNLFDSRIHHIRKVATEGMEEFIKILKSK
ncbi:MAG: NAD-dependent protein deacylase [Bacteroidales bacterium]|nr:NAD-dependent protein deacylase [Bacteroidales bacterium]